MTPPSALPDRVPATARADASAHRLRDRARPSSHVQIDGSGMLQAGTERVEIACAGGYGRAGTALACLAVLDRLPGRRAIAYVREHYASRAVETPWQRRFITRF
jgi:hypothetical protein